MRLKIPRGAIPVPVRVRPPAPELLALRATNFWRPARARDLTKQARAEPWRIIDARPSFVTTVAKNLHERAGRDRPRAKNGAVETSLQRTLVLI